MHLRTSTGLSLNILGVRDYHRMDQRVHNLTIEGVHTYHVSIGDVDVLVHNSDDVCDAAWGGALHIQEEWMKGERNHAIPDVDMKDVEAIARDLHDILNGQGGRSVQGCKTVFYDKARGYFVLRVNGYMTTGRKMTQKDFDTWYRKNKD